MDDIAQLIQKLDKMDKAVEARMCIVLRQLHDTFNEVVSQQNTSCGYDVYVKNDRHAIMHVANEFVRKLGTLNIDESVQSELYSKRTRHILENGDHTYEKIYHILYAAGFITLWERRGL